MQDNLQINSAAITDKGLSEKRPQNEDSYLELIDSGLYAVADGVGGAQAGDVASQMAMEILGEGFINLQEDGDAEERMKSAIQQANSAIFQTSHELAQLSTMATTIVALHINGNIATIGHVGDSRLYRLDVHGNLFRETQDHSVVEEEVRAGRMTPEQALTHPSRNVISRALGAEQTVEIDMKTIMFEPNTKFLVCSDGVTRHIPDEEIRSILMTENDNFQVCQTIKELCFERGAEDNLTAVIVSITEASEEAFANNDGNLSDFDEDTVATARPPLVNSAVFGNTREEIAEQPQMQNIAMSETVESISGYEESDEEIIIPTISDSNSNKISISTNDNDNSSDNLNAKNDIESIRADENRSSGIFGKILSAIVWLIIGGVLGALGYYFYSNSNILNAGNSTQTSVADKQISTFEQKRRVVDNNPGEYAANNVNPGNAEEHYLLGRASFLSGQFETATKELEIAKEKIAEFDEINRKVVENDIVSMLENIANKAKSSGTEKVPAVEKTEGAETKSLEEVKTPAEEPIKDVPKGNDN